MPRLPRGGIQRNGDGSTEGVRGAQCAWLATLAARAALPGAGTDFGTWRGHRGPDARTAGCGSAGCHPNLADCSVDLTGYAGDGPAELAVPALANLAYPAGGDLAGRHLYCSCQGQIFEFASLVVCATHRGTGLTQPGTLAPTHLDYVREPFPFGHPAGRDV